MRQIDGLLQIGVNVMKKLYRFFVNLYKPFVNSDDYWKHRYESGGNSGAGSYADLSTFKAEVLNAFVLEKNIATVIEYGCGDGNQLSLAQYPSYIGFDISPKALELCKIRFKDDKSKTFRLMDDYAGEKAELTLSLDVIYHLIEDAVFNEYMERLFNSSERFVVIYSSDTDHQRKIQAPHVRHRKFSMWVQKNRPEWQLLKHIPNKYPLTVGKSQGSFADFYLYYKI